MVRNCKDDDPLSLGPIDDREREFLDENLARIRAMRSARGWKDKCACNRLLHCRSEAQTQTGLHLAVIDDLG